MQLYFSDQIPYIKDAIHVLMKLLSFPDLQGSPISKMLSENSLSNEEDCKSSTLHIPEPTNSAALLVVESSKADVLKSSKPLVVSSHNKPSDLPTTVPIFVSRAPTGLTSPIALRSVNNGLGKGTKAYPSFIADSHRESTDNTAFNKECTAVKHNHIASRQIGNLSRQSSPLDAFFSSIAERTRSQSSKCSYSALVTPKVTKRAKRQLSKLEITVNTFKSYSSNKKVMKDEDGFHEASRKQGIVSGNTVKRDSGKRKRPQKQPISESKKQCHNASNYQHPNDDEMKPNSELENKENDGNLSKSEGGMDKNEVHLNNSDGELDSSDGSKSVLEIEKGKDERVFGATEGEFDEENSEKELAINGEDRCECKHKEEQREDKLDKENKNEGENEEEKYGGELDKSENGEDKCQRGLDKDEDKSKVGNKEDILEDKNEKELDQSKEYKSDGELDSEEGKDVASTTDPKPSSISAGVR